MLSIRSRLGIIFMPHLATSFEFVARNLHQWLFKAFDDIPRACTVLYR